MNRRNSGSAVVDRPRPPRIIPEPRPFLFYRGSTLVGEGVAFSTGSVSACALADGRMMAFADMANFMAIQQRRGAPVHIHFLDRRCYEPHLTYATDTQEEKRADE